MRQLTPDQMQTVIETAAAVSAVLAGSCKEEIARLTALKADVDAKVAAIGGLGKAEKVKAEADAYAARVKAEADERAEAAKLKGNAAAELQDRAQALDASVNAGNAALAKDRAKHASDVARWSAGVEEQERKLAAQELGLKVKGEAVERDRQILVEREKKLNARLEALKAPV